MALQQTLVEVLIQYCCPETVEKFQQSTKKAKTKWIDALKTVFDKALNLEITTRTGGSKEMLARASRFEYQKKTDPLLVKAMTLLKCKVIFDYSPLKEYLSTWGKRESREMTLMNHFLLCTAHLNLRKGYEKEKGFFSHTNKTVTKEQQSKYDISKLKETCIQDLKLFEISKGKFLRGKCITRPMLSVGVYTYIEDRNGDILKLGMYNMLPNCEDQSTLAEVKFPIGTSIIVCEPFYKIFVDGTLGVRVDSPDEVSIIQDEESLSFESVKEKGRNMVKSGDFFGALELYFCGLTKFKEEVELLLSNRSQTELKLGNNEQALLDAAAVLFLNSNNEKSRIRYGTAKQRINPCDYKDLWEKLLTINSLPIESLGEMPIQSCTREQGNQSFKEGKFLEAKQIYSNALKEFENMTVLLNNIAIVCLKTAMFHTAISAANVCLRLTSNEEHRKKALFSMTKSFVTLGELEFAELSARDDPILRRCHEASKNTKDILNQISFKIALLISSGKFAYEDIRQCLLESEIPNDFINGHSLEHFYSSSSGNHGIRAKRYLTRGEIVFVDHLIMCPDKTEEQQKVTFATVDSNSREIIVGTPCQNDLKHMLLSRLKYDGLLAKKLLLTEQQSDFENEDKDKHGVDLTSIGFYSLSPDIAPFLPQTLVEAGLNDIKLDSKLIENIMEKQCIGLRADETDQKSIKTALALRLRFIKKSTPPNCVALPIRTSMVVMILHDVEAGDELRFEVVKR